MKKKPAQPFGERTMAIYDSLGEFYEPEEAFEWFMMPHPQLGWQSAARLCDAGRHAEVEAVIARLRADGYL